MKVAAKTLKLFRAAANLVAPPPPLTVSEWADEHRRLSPESSAAPGRWRTDRAPFQREIMDSVNDPESETVIVMSSAQVGKTELILNTIGYFMDHDPSPIMLIQPTLEMAETFSKDRLAPMLRDTPKLRSKVKGAKGKDSGNTLLHKNFAGGQITMAGANSPASLASRPIRVVLLDEVDRYPASAGTEGDPVSLVSKRTTTFWNRKRIMVSTPTIAGASRIEDEYLSSTMEEWCLPCPSCGEYQPLEWSRVHLEDAKMACECCGFHFSEFEWKNGVQKGKWIAQQESTKRGFHLNELASPWKRWTQIIAEYNEAKDDDEMLKTWWNTALGLPWDEMEQHADEEDRIEITEKGLCDRQEDYRAVVPDDVRVLTAGVDVQGNRLEVEVVGWGRGKESWGIEYRQIVGDPAKPEVWAKLDEYLDRIWRRADGMGLRVASTTVDSGGHHTTEVYRYCVEREYRNVWAIKGKGGYGVPVVGRVSETPREKAHLFIIGVDDLKGKLMTRLKAQVPGPGYCHFPSDPERGYDETYFKGLLSEKKVIRRHRGVKRIKWVKKSNVRNEPLDLRNYATAALEILNPNLEAPARLIGDYKGSGSQAKPAKKKRRGGTLNRGISV
ncbi:phage terminase large subunit family protein [Tumebacillus flagellatus]|uniref:Terminase n=1 Tax=Tumebacillus flagellatus TaxID=1157490 RepID=A0A074MGC9_9BACL|nr:phage terminase large subunit family protein [Tumebacillus flagellatus]KEO84767.1 terminase [Tumebacillus flagellatus]